MVRNRKEKAACLKNGVFLDEEACLEEDACLWKGIERDM